MGNDDGASVASTAASELDELLARERIARREAERKMREAHAAPGAAEARLATYEKMYAAIAAQILDPNEELEARRTERVLRDIAKIEAKVQAGEKVDKLQLQKLAKKEELENSEVMLKIARGWNRDSRPQGELQAAIRPRGELKALR